MIVLWLTFNIEIGYINYQLKFTRQDNNPNLTQETGCKRFKVYKDRLPFSEERVCEIQGEEDSVALAAQMALDILVNHPVDHAHLNYMPLPDGLGESGSGDFGGYSRFAGPVRSQVNGTRCKPIKSLVKE